MSVLTFPRQESYVPTQFEINRDSKFYEGLVGWWAMGNPACVGSNTLLDLSPYGNHGTLTLMDPATDWVHDGERAGLDFDGSNDGVEVPNFTLLQGKSELTICGWFRTTNFNSSGPGMLFRANNVVALGGDWTETRAGCYAYVSGTWRYSGDTTSVNDDAWHFLVGTFDGTVRVWLDGQLASSSASYGGTVGSNSDPVTIGKRYANTEQFAGQLDDIRVYNRALSANEISRLYNETKPGGYGSLLKPKRTSVFLPKEPSDTFSTFNIVTTNTTKPSEPTSKQLELNVDSPFAKGLVGFWPMGNRACIGSNKLIDLSMYGNHGTLTNMDAGTDWVHDGGRNALDFDGSNDHIVTSQLIDVTKDITISYWNFVSTAVDGSAFGTYESSDTNRCQCHSPWSDNTLYWDYGNQASNGRLSTSYSNYLGKWTLVTLVGTAAKTWQAIYLDGVEKATSTTSNAPASSSAMWIGAWRKTSLTTYYSSGKIDDFRIYNKALSANEVTQLYQETKDGTYGSLVKPKNTTVYFEEPIRNEPKPFFITGVTKKSESPSTPSAQKPLQLNVDSPFAEGLVGFWPMGNQACRSSNKLLDLSPYGNHGTLAGMDPATDWVQDSERAGLDFDGTSEYIFVSTSANKSLDIADEITLAAMVKINTFLGTSDWQSVIEFNDTIDSFVQLNITSANHSDGVGKVHTNLVSTTSSFRQYQSDNQELLASQWALVTITRKAAIVSLYVDGKVVPNSVQPGSTAIGATETLKTGGYGALRCGYRISTGTLALNAKLAFVAIYNRALSSQEIQQLYNETRDGSYGTLTQPKKTTLFFPDQEEPVQVETFSIISTPSKTSETAVTPLEINRDSPFYEGLVGFWPMGNQVGWGGNKLLDLSPYGNHGSLQNMNPATDWVHDGERAGLDFDGGDDYVTSSSLSLSTLSVSCWLTGSSPDGYGNLVSQAYTTSGSPYYEWGLTWSGSNKLRAVLTTGGVATNLTGSIIITSNVWTHAVFTYDGSLLSLFVDNVLDTSTTVTGVRNNYNQPLRFGAWQWSTTSYSHRGQLDDIRIYNRALTANEVTQLYNETKAGGYGSLIKQRTPIHLNKNIISTIPKFKRRQSYTMKNYRW